MTSAAGPQSPPDQVWVPAPVAARIRGACSRAGLSLLVTGALLVVLTMVLVVAVPNANGFLSAVTISGGTVGGFLVLLAGIGLLNARLLVSGQSFLAGRARRTQRLLVVLWLLSAALTLLCAIGISGVSDGPILGLLIVPTASCVLTTIAVFVARSVLNPTGHARS